ncbi:SRPBCC domain-containing protein [Streptomyces ziwulingensis]|uniref:SRPBCC domain-containing protein n=1 Tax=Streptomyces ziwulingensis TaxID=1045501 RepID=A0ABP9BL43_9ACTN
MEHEVFVPVPAERLREALADPARVAGAVPGLQQDAGAEPIAGRLKVRVGSHSVTYRGAVRLSAGGDGGYVLEGDATETRGTGTVALALALRVRESDGGCTLAFTGTATADGRLTELPADAVAASATRLLTRFAERLAETAGQGSATEAEAADTAAGTETGAADTAAGTETEEAAGTGTGTDAEPPALPDPPSSVFDADVPPSALGREPEDDGAVVPPAEAAHARRTMIGRSAEEVDHAPPRGRYAPVPVPEDSASVTSLRWAAPAAAVVLASAIVVGRALRRRR